MCLELFTPLELNGLKLKNRIVMTPLQLGYANGDGSVSPLLLDHYREMARSGVALVVVEYCAVDPLGVGISHTLRVDDERFLPGLADLAQAIHQEGALAALQINHCGRFGFTSEKPPRRIFCPRPRLSASPTRTWGVKPRAMTIQEIECMVDAFARGAKLVKQAGFDAVEVHGAAGYLISQFLSPRTNRRADEYGGTVENRMRFALEVVDAVLAAVGQGYPVGYRFMPDEGVPGGLGPEESSYLVSELERRGVTYLSVITGGFDILVTRQWEEKEKHAGYMAADARRVKKIAPQTPVLACGRIQTPELANEILRQVDLIGLARVLLADPLWPKKAAGEIDAPIVSCEPDCSDCKKRLRKARPAFCSQWKQERQTAFLNRVGER